ncbi:MAG: hypothetical protein HPY78_02625 [Brevinematales bacterium]|nr:hypothetical protein [Brevinematales bacterium]
MKRFVSFVSWFFLSLMILFLLVGNLFYKIWQPLAKEYLSNVLPSSEELPEPSSHRYEMSISLSKSLFSRYEPVSFSVVVRQRKTSAIVSNAFVRLRAVDKEGNVLLDIRGQDEIWVSYDPEKRSWNGIWYPDLNNRSETVRLVFSVQFESPLEPLVEEREITLKQTPVFRSSSQGLSFLFIEEMESLSRRSLLALDNEERDWNVLPQWINFLNVDGVLVMGGVTRFMEDYSLQDPWNNQKMQEALTIARWAAGQGRQAGVWVKAFRGDGNLLSGTGYESSWYQKDNQWLQDVSTISFASESRYRVLASLLGSLSQQDSLAYVGISDYLLPDNYGMELAIPFVETVVSRLPQDWTNRSFEQKFAFARNYLENSQNYQAFLQWKRYYVVGKLREMIRSVRKPVFYVLNWEELESQRDLLDTLASAGCDFFVIQLKMSYRDFMDMGRKLLEHPLIRPYLSRIVWVNQIQYQNFYFSSDMPFSIEGFVAMNEAVVKNAISSQPAFGLGVNFYKAMYGNRGPYNPIEWLMGAGESFARVRRIRSHIPLDVDVVVPRSVGGNSFQIRVRVQNKTLMPIEKLALEHIPTRMIRINGAPKVEWNTLSPGEISEAVVGFSIDQASDKFVRSDGILAFRVFWTYGGKQDSFILMRTVTIQPSEQTTNQ